MIDQRRSKGAKTRDKVLETAAQLFQQQGYAATSINQIISRSGQPKGSLYFHFPGGKQEIAMAAAAQSSELILVLINDIFTTSKTLLEAMTFVCTAFSSQLQDSEYRDGCPISPLTTSSKGEASPLRQSCAAAFEGWLDAIKDGLVRHGIAITECAALASLILSSVEGAILLSQARHNTEALEQLPASLAPLLEKTGEH